MSSQECERDSFKSNPPSVIRSSPRVSSSFSQIFAGFDLPSSPVISEESGTLVNSTGSSICREYKWSFNFKLPSIEPELDGSGSDEFNTALGSQESDLADLAGMFPLLEETRYDDGESNEEVEALVVTEEEVGIVAPEWCLKFE